MSYHVNPIPQSFPRLGARSVGATPTIAEPTLASRLATLRRNGATADQLDYFQRCMATGRTPLSICTHNMNTITSPPASASAPQDASAPVVAPAIGGSRKWVWIAGAAGVAVLAFVLLKPAHA